MTDVIHKDLMICVDDWAIIIGGDSHTHVKGVAFGADSGTVSRSCSWRKLLCQFLNQ
jgi:aconitase B